MNKVYNVLRKEYKQISGIERGQIEAYIKMGLSISEIARKLSRSKSTIWNEINKGTYKGKYQAHIAQNRTEKRKKESHKHTKWRNIEVLHYIERGLKQNWSPEIISKKLLEEKGIEFSTSSVYNVIKKHRPEFLKLLPHKGKKLTHKASVLKIPDRISIDERPLIVDFRDRFGDWEADTVLSCRSGISCLAVFVERLSRFYRIIKMPDKSADSMFEATLKALSNEVVETITYDNGTENFRHNEVNKILHCESYFCNAYHSWEKGAIENRNKILRQFLPKGTNFDLLSDEDIANIQIMINSRPMKCLNWLSPVEVFDALRSAYCYNVPYSKHERSVTF